MSEAGERGYAVSSLEEMGEGYGFRKIRRALGAIVVAAGRRNGYVRRDGRAVDRGAADGPPPGAP